MICWIVLIGLCFFSPLHANCFYPVPEGYTSIEPCNQSEALAFWKMLQKRRALIGENDTLSHNADGTITIHLQEFSFGFILLDSGAMREDTSYHAKETYVLYKGNIHHDGHLCYMLESTNGGSGNFDFVLGVWKVIEDRIERLYIYDDLASTFFPGSDAHLFYGHHANPFLIEKGGTVFIRWVDGYFPSAPSEGHHVIGPFGMYVYYWEGNTLRYVPSLSKGANPIIDAHSHTHLR